MPRTRDALLNAGGLAAAGTVVEREFQIADFTRLADRLAGPEGKATVRLALGRTGDVVTGDLRVQASAQLICQRCLAPMRRMVEADSRLAFVESEDAAVPADREAILCDPERLDLTALVEEELLLSLPLIARHAEGEACGPPDGASTLAAGERAGAAPKAMRRPFAGLKELLKH